jgi:hypothetical protein
MRIAIALLLVSNRKRWRRAFGVNTPDHARKFTQSHLLLGAHQAESNICVSTSLLIDLGKTSFFTTCTHNGGGRKYTHSAQYIFTLGGPNLIQDWFR